jgi:hypothetical protein
MISIWDLFPEGMGSFLVIGPPRVRSALRCLSSLLPRQWGTVTPLEPSCEGLSLRPLLQRPRRTVFGKVLGMRAKARSFGVDYWCKNRSSNTPNRAVSNSERASRRRSSPNPLCAPGITFRSGQHGPLECDFYRAKYP